MTILLGPMLRWVGTDSATVWLETDGPDETRILGHTQRTFHVAGHHYALVSIEGLEPGTSYPYEVALDGVVCWPAATPEPQSTITTLPADGPIRIAFGSCRLAGPRSAPRGLDRLMRGYEAELDALVAYGDEHKAGAVTALPQLLLMLGDQVYADNAPESSRRYARARRDVSKPPGETMADFEEFTRLYRDSWSEPTVRWLFSTVPSAMVFDDHELM